MELLELIAAAAISVWLVYFALRGSLVAGCLGFCLATCCLGYPFWQSSIGPLPLTIDRLVIVLLAGVYVAQRALGRTDPKPLAFADKLLLIFLTVLTVSCFTHRWRDLPPTEVSPLWRLMVGYWFPALIYWVVRQSRLGARQIGTAHGMLAFFGLYLAATGLLEAAHQWAFVFPRYIADPTVGLHYGRARGPMVQAVSYGLCLGITMLAGFVWRYRWNRIGQLFWFAVVPLQLTAIYFSYTRSIWIGTSLAIFVFLWLTLRGVWRTAIVGGLAAIMLLAAVMNLDKLTDLQREGSATEAADSATMRESFAYVSWQMFWDRPIWGCGFGHFYDEKLPYLSDRRTPLKLEEIRDYVHHNTYLSLLTETGLIGLSLFLAVLACWIRLGWRLARDGLPPWVRAHGILLLAALATYCTQMMFHEVSYTSIDNSIVFLLAGLASGLAPVAAGKRQISTQRESLASAAGSESRGQMSMTAKLDPVKEVAEPTPRDRRAVRSSPLLLGARSLIQSLLRRQPGLYALARRAYGQLTFRLRIPHEPDFHIFAALEGTRGLFLDVGANSGQSARSLRMFNRSLDILSFEPNRLLESDLRFTRRLLGRTFRYRMHGLGSTNRRTTLYVPTVGPTPHTPWATADRQLLERSRPSIERELGRPFNITEVPIEICRGDDLRFRPVVIKIDVEGLELDVLQGLEATLDRSEPLLMIERNIGSGTVAAWLEARGYQLFVYNPATNRLQYPETAPAPTNFIACTAGWLARFPQVSGLIGTPRAEIPAATNVASN
ncbi:MAG TPA: FkbM family methyltransferase [Pirellulales bacterium]|jgi:FkbM family methyltransferase|nr:FkbM family methyltransferase [Pirellulales bacterium]